MKLSWQNTRVWLKRPLDPSVPIVARRFGVRLLILSFFAAMPLSHGWGFAHMFVMLTGINALYEWHHLAPERRFALSRRFVVRTSDRSRPDNSGTSAPI